MLNFEIEFQKWLAGNLNEEIPEAVQAFSMNLFEPYQVKGVKFGIVLIGADRFEPNDDDWACYEVWSPNGRELLIPIEYSTDDWKECLKKIKILARAFLNMDSTRLCTKVAKATKVE